MDPIPLNAVRAAAPDVAADTPVTALAVLVADIGGAAELDGTHTGEVVLY